MGKCFFSRMEKIPQNAAHLNMKYWKQKKIFHRINRLLWLENPCENTWANKFQIKAGFMQIHKQIACKLLFERIIIWYKICELFRIVQFNTGSQKSYLPYKSGQWSNKLVPEQKLLENPIFNSFQSFPAAK